MQTVKDLTDVFFSNWVAMCERLEANPHDVASVCMAESGMFPWAHNPNGHASGLNQLMPFIMRGLGFYGFGGYQEPPGLHSRNRKRIEQLTKLIKKNTPLGVDVTAESNERKCLLVDQADLDEKLAYSYRKQDALQQLPWVERYYAPHKGKLTSIAAVYVVTFVPADILLAQDPEAVLVARKDSELSPDPVNGRRASFLLPNVGFDKNKDGAIQVKELGQAVQRADRGPRSDAIHANIREAQGLQPEVPSTQPASFDLDTPRGVQQVLQQLGYYKGDIDGQFGPESRAAAKAFQLSAKLIPDGIVGPRTKFALADLISQRISH